MKAFYRLGYHYQTNSKHQKLLKCSPYYLLGLRKLSEILKMYSINYR